ncbi:signal peptidase I [Paenarthrobacter nitroguajacolicus]|uniref:signal peptidase I n=1 Tax=Paenarthrobacter nitroguajacolicus TaxID=211146 RepID=UPI00285D10DE|nr:signal peptidase I [Paenarthrobacter nitroguajacolicus]MDR6638436.1 signal peptidase [Paenarthrobacter nitroguajacolicus]
MSALSTIPTSAVRGRRSAKAAPSAAVESAAVENVAPSAAVESAAGTQRGVRRVAGLVVKSVGIGMLVLAALVFLFLAIGPRVLGYQTSTMLTGSMAPLINPGDVVVTVPTPIADVKVGDIITYHIPVEDQRVETHRITEITATADGGVAVQTKGDANNGIDPWIATLQGKTVDKQVATIPYVGNAIRALREPMVRNILMYGAPAILVIGMLASIWTKDSTKTTPKGVAEPKAASGE